MHRIGKIIAIGGGGFTHNTDPELEDFILSHCPVRRPSIGYIGAANRNDPTRIRYFYERFASPAFIADHLSNLRPLVQAAAWVAKQDIIYLGGGNSAELISRLRASGLMAALAEASAAGALLAGVSAGAVCWFDAALSTSAGNGLAPLPCFGMIAGSCCPHYSSEPQRQPAFRAHIAGGLLPDGIAIDDGVAVLLEPGQPARAYSARPGAGAYLVTRRGKCVVTIRCPFL